LNIITSVKDQQVYCKKLLDNQKNISLIPTMGNLHLGHESLFKASLDDEIRISSVFINPLQFNDKNDYSNYPKSLDRDIEILKLHNIDCLFLPDEKDILSYRLDIRDYKLPEFSNVLCGKYRKKHFQGVFKIVKKLFEIIQPTKAYFGKKDYQQLLLVKYLVSKFFDSRIDIVACETKREKNGLAMSSRNNQLSNRYKDIASMVYSELCQLKVLMKIDKNLFPKYRDKLIKKLVDNNIRVEYLEILSRKNLSELIDDTGQYNIFIAFYVNNIRLIDNLEI
tara:strand:- start:1090 stop:1929 length:840 start_codon:yes stop_codon:yes gene_type:complete